MYLNKVQSFFQEKPDIYVTLKKVINHSLELRRAAISSSAFGNECDILNEYGFIKIINVESFEINYDSVEVCEVLLDIAKEKSMDDIPIDIIQSLEWVDKFVLEIRKPEPRTFWYGSLERMLERQVLIHLNNNHNLDITAFLFTITEQMEDEYVPLRNFTSTYREIFPFLSDDIDTAFGAISYLYNSENTVYAANEGLQKLAEVDPSKAILMLEHGKQKGDTGLSGFFPNLLIGLYPTDPDRFLNEAFDLFNLSPNEGILALARIKYETEKHVESAFEFVTSRNIETIEYLRNLPTFVTRIINNVCSRPETKAKGFEALSSCLDIKDDQLIQNLVWRLGMLKGYDDEKYALLPKVMSLGKTGVLERYFDYFNSPKYLFEFVTEAYLEHGLGVNFNLFSAALNMQYHKNAEAFKSELVRLLTDDLAIIRHVGIQILMSNNGDVYPVDFLKLTEQQQIRIIDALLPLPRSIEELFPLIIQLRNSDFENVRKKLTTELVELIWAFDYGLIELANLHLNVSNHDDALLKEELDRAFTTYDGEKKMKLGIKEFDPIENELEMVDLFFRLELEKNTESMDKASRMGVFSQLAKNISVIRGSGFKVGDGNNVSMMARMEVSRLMDQRYSINPEAYEWNFRVHALGKNYNPEET